MNSKSDQKAEKNGSMLNFEEEFNNRIKRTENIITRYLPEPEGYGSRVIEALNYSFLSGGKRLRPLLLIETHILCGGDGNLIAPFMAAIEMIHTYSLVHDDLPAMDNDRLRRGRPTTWAQYDEACAILAGDALLNLAAETVTYAFELANTPEEIGLVAAAIRILFHHSGIWGMIGGQCADIGAEAAEDITEEELIYIHKNKTAALIRAAMTIGALLAGAEDKTIIAVDRAAYCIGLAFQIQDDILDVCGDEKTLGKPIGSDKDNGKKTYVTMHGLEASRTEVERLSNEALDIVKNMPVRNEFLEQLITYMIRREK